MSLTFAQLDQQKGAPMFAVTGEEEFSLPGWYQSIHDVPLEKLSPRDIALACRHDIHRAATVPIALELLEDSIAESGMYDEELLTSLINIASIFWVKHDSLLQPLKLMIQNGRDAFLPNTLIKARAFLGKVSR
jgi:hypothetical protein